MVGRSAVRGFVLAVSFALIAGGFTLARAAESTYEGVLTRITVDPEGLKGDARVDYRISLSEGGAKSVIPSPGAFGGRSPRSLDGKTVDVTGVEEEPGVIQASRISHAGPASEDIETELTGNRPYAVLLCKFSDIPAEPHAPSYYTGLMGASYPGEDHFWQTNSYNLLNLTGSTVFGWFTLPQPRSFYTVPGVPDFDEMLLFDHCAAAANPTVNFAAFQTGGINIMFNATANAALGGGTDVRLLDGVNQSWRATWMPTWGHDSGTLAHEMAHTFGLPHSGSQYTGNPGWPYDNEYDVVSSGLCNQTHPTYDCVGTQTIAHHKDLQGWIAPIRKYTAPLGSSVVIRMWPLGHPAPAGSEYLMATIPIFGAPVGHFYTAELRRKANQYDVGVPFEGIVVHDVDLARGEGEAQLIDHDADGDPRDDGSILVQGEAFLDAGGSLVEPLASFPDGSMDVRIGYRSPGALIAQTGGSTQVTEGGATDTYTVRLTSPPAANVTVTPSNGGGQLSLSPPSVTFTSANWSTPQTFTVSAVNDTTPEPSPHNATVTHAVASSDPAYSGLGIPTVAVAIIDNDGSVLIAQSGGTTQVTEGGATDSYTAVLAGPPSANVVVTPAVTGGQITFSPPSLTFTPGNWNLLQAVTVTAVNDAVDETSPGAATITHASASGDTGYNGIPVPSVPVSIFDNDVAGVTVVQSGGTTQVTEGGATDSYTVVLTSQPTSNVTVNATFPAGDITLSASSLTFTPGNWNVAQTIVVTAVNDGVDEPSPETVLVSHSVVSSDGFYNGIGVPSVSVSVIDDDTAGVVVTQSGGTTSVTEGGPTDTYTIVLASQPAANVTVTSSFPAGDITLSASSLLFTTANWNIAQTVTVTAVNDAVDEASPENVTITHAVTSSDGQYNGLPAASVAVAVLDNDVAGVTVVQSGGNTQVTEGGATDSYTVVLTSQPTANVTVTPAFAGTDITLSASSLLFTAANWSVAQTVTVTAVNDAVDEASPEIVVISHSVSSADGFYNGLPVASVSVSVIDNDTAGVTITQSGGTTQVTEGGAADSYTLVLSSQPLANVTVNASFAPGQIALSTTSLTFTTANWNTPQSITVTAINDAIDETSPMNVLVTHAAVSSDPLYNGIPVGSVNVSVIDNDTAGVTLGHTGGSTEVAEGGATDTFTVVLTSQPTAGVTVNLTGGGGQVTLSQTSLSFNAGNWNVVQSVTVAAVDDSVEEADPHTATINASVTSADPFYNGISVPPLTVSIRDNDDQTRPSSIWLTGNNSVVLGGTPVLGRSSDLRSGIQKVDVEISPLVGTMQRVPAQITSCDALRRLCSWQVNLSILQIPGIYRFTAKATDNFGNQESPGPTITIVIV